MSPHIHKKDPSKVMVNVSVPKANGAYSYLRHISGRNLVNSLFKWSALTPEISALCVKAS